MPLLRSAVLACLVVVSAVASSVTSAAATCVATGTAGIDAFRELRDPSAGASTHPLIGALWAAKSVTGQDCKAPCADCAVDAWVEQVYGARERFVLLGEVHDNSSHHAFRALVIHEIGKASERQQRSQPGLVFEHIRGDQQAALDALATLPDAKAADAFRLLNWQDTGWPEEKLFAPLFTVALRLKMSIMAGDPSRGLVRDVARRGVAALPDGEAARLKLDAPLPDAQQDALLTELEGSHCGLMPKSAFGNMSVAQRLRDAHLAGQLAKAGQSRHIPVLLAGNGHVRADRGVPYYLRQMSDKPIVSVMLLEVVDGQTDPEAYIPRSPDGAPAVDFVVFTPRAARKDPCAEMREHMKKKP